MYTHKSLHQSVSQQISTPKNTPTNLTPPNVSVNKKRKKHTQNRDNREKEEVPKFLENKEKKIERQNLDLFLKKKKDMLPADFRSKKLGRS